ncbi:MAG: hypothetical protein MjAS7_2416 [Metallosphaera javensis (ex Sakai et al. 2022)]|nr:MAG: hypothetical protein MjAS7_2416 [Metallosphaera javensis (ex Sakai et al. 2022)]
MILVVPSLPRNLNNLTGNFKGCVIEFYQGKWEKLNALIVER